MAKIPQKATQSLKWEDLDARSKAVINMDWDSGFTRRILEEMSMRIDSRTIDGLETAYHAKDAERMKEILFTLFLDCIFDDVQNIKPI